MRASCVGVTETYDVVDYAMMGCCHFVPLL